MSPRNETLLVAATIGFMAIAMIYFMINHEYDNIVLLFDAWMHSAPNFFKNNGR